MKDTINVHAQFSGEVAETIDEIIRRGRAASRTEAIRLAIVTYRDHHLDHSEQKNKPKALRDLGGATKGKLGSWVEKEDRVDVRD